MTLPRQDAQDDFLERAVALSLVANLERGWSFLISQRDFNWCNVNVIDLQYFVISRSIRNNCIIILTSETQLVENQFDACFFTYTFTLVSFVFI